MFIHYKISIFIYGRIISPLIFLLFASDKQKFLRTHLWVTPSISFSSPDYDQETIRHVPKVTWLRQRPALAISSLLWSDNGQHWPLALYCGQYVRQWPLTWCELLQASHWLTVKDLLAIISCESYVQSRVVTKVLLCAQPPQSYVSKSNFN